MTTGCEVRVLDLAADDALLEQWIQTRTDSARADLGDFARPFTLAEYRAAAAHPHSSRTPFAALLDGEVVAGGNVTLPLADNTSLAWLVLQVAQRWRRRGIGTAIPGAGCR